MGANRISSHSRRDGCAATLYANGIDPVDIQRWGRWRSPIYMRYLWRENGKPHTLSFSLVKGTRLMNQLLAPSTKKRKVAVDDDFRCGVKDGQNEGLWIMMGRFLDGLGSNPVTPEKDGHITPPHNEYEQRERTGPKMCRHGVMIPAEGGFDMRALNKPPKLEEVKKEEFGAKREIKLAKRERGIAPNESFITWRKEEEGDRVGSVDSGNTRANRCRDERSLSTEIDSGIDQASVADTNVMGSQSVELDNPF